MNCTRIASTSGKNRYSTPGDRRVKSIPVQQCTRDWGTCQYGKGYREETYVDQLGPRTIRDIAAHDSPNPDRMPISLG